MQHPPVKVDRRREPRIEADDILRWKHPGRIEDRKGWMVDRGPSSVGFFTDAEALPRVGDVLNLRRQDGDAWIAFAGTVHVARTALMPTGDLVMVGCTID